MRRRIIVSLVLIAGLLALGSGVAVLLVTTRPEPPTRDTDRPPLLVEAITVRPQTLVEPIVGYGTARADRFARLSAQVAGEIVELADQIKPGVRVERGQMLCRIDAEQYVRLLEAATSRRDADRAQLAELDIEGGNVDRLAAIARRELEIAQKEFDRVKALFEDGRSHPREFDEYHRALQKARSALQILENRKALLPSRRTQWEAVCRNREAEVRLAQLDVERCRIVAPFDGRIDDVMIELGERVQVGQDVVALLNPDRIEIPIELPASVRHRVEADAPCRLSVDSAAQLAWTGRVARISPTASESTRTFRLYVEVNNAEQATRLVPGFFIRAVIDGATLKNVLVVPRGAIQQDHVFVYNDDHAHRRRIEVVRRMLDQAVVDGLKPGDVVITSNLDALHEGAVVRWDGAPAPPARAAAATSGRSIDEP